jgi:hypothetical protein|nr:MAG TPA: hypothetical protein [Caudoviricetes sp.]
MNLGSRRLGAGCSTCGGVNRPTNQCDERKVVSISKAGDSLIIALDDCTFFKADMSVLDPCVCGDGTGANPADVALIKSLKDSIAKLQEKVTALEAKEDKDTVFNPESLIGRIAALESKEDKDTVYDDTALAARVKALEDAPAGDRVDTTAFVRKSDLIDVANFAGTVRFKAYPADVAGDTEAAPITNLETDLDHL